MPVGVIINSLSIVIGGIIGSFVGHLLTDDFKEKLNMIFGVCAMTLGITSMVLIENMPAVIFATLVGTMIGLAIHLGHLINVGGSLMERGLAKVIPNKSSLSEDEFRATLLTIIVLFCSSGTGIYGSIVSGMSGDHSILIAKSILDFFTSVIFGCTMGMVVSVIAIPQFIIFTMLFMLAGAIFPLTTPAMLNDFKACGGIIMLATGFRMIKVKMFPTADMIPAMIIVMPVSWFWTTYIIPLLS